jgi:type II secretion system protein H
MKKNKTKKGFTLLEIMVVVSIIAIMTGIMIISLNQSKNRQALKTSAGEVVAAIRETQNYALTGKSAGGSCNNYYFQFSGQNYTVYNGNGSCGISDSYVLSESVNFNGSGTITFTAPHGNTSGTTIVLSRGGDNINICVSDTGMIQETFSSCP